MTEPLVIAVLVCAIIQIIILIVILRRSGHPSNDISAQVGNFDASLQRVQQAMRGELGISRKEASVEARNHREEARNTMGQFRSENVNLMSKLGQFQKGQLDIFGQYLKNLNESITKELEKIRFDANVSTKEARDESAKTMKDFREHLSGRFEETRNNLESGLKSSRAEIAKLKADIAKNLEQIRLDSAESAKQTRDESAKSMDAFREQLSTRFDIFARQLADLLERNDKKSDALRISLEQQFEKVRQANEQKLDQMRQTVDEKLQGTLDKRLREQFGQVHELLGNVHKGLGEMQTLASGVGDLKRVMTNIKSRGTWGEVQLARILEDYFTPTQYDVNVVTKPGSNERVEFAIKMPGRSDEDGSIVYLPIDSKFPREAYDKLIEAQEAADADAVAVAVKQLESGVKCCAKDICEKYLCPPATTDFGIMFLPTEGLYAEVVRRTGIVEYCQRECRVAIAGPTTLAAFLNALHMGFRTLAIEKRTSDVWKVLAAVKTEFDKFGGIIGKVKKKLQEASNTIDEAETRTRVMNRKLKGVEALPSEQTFAVLELSVGENGEMEQAIIEEPLLSSERLRWTPLVGRPIGLNKVVGLAARGTLTGLARPLQLFNFLMY